MLNGRKKFAENGNLAQRIADALSRQILETGELKSRAKDSERK
jgi:hypothetical protein